LLQRWILAHPIGIDRSTLPFSLFFYEVIEKKYLQSLKWGLIPRYPSHSVTKAMIC
jgi:hypothetical protein